MSDYFDFPPNEFDEEGDENPFKDLAGWSDEAELRDPYEEMTEDIMDNLGIEEFDDIVFDIGSVDPEDLRGNRFESLEEAIIYLFDAGILRFSGVVLDGDEIAVDIDAESN